MLAFAKTIKLGYDSAEHFVYITTLKYLEPFITLKANDNVQKQKTLD